MQPEVVPILRVADAERSVRWYERLGFTKEWEHRFAAELPAFVSVARGGARLFLSEHTGDAQGEALVYLRAPDVERIADELGGELHDQPWALELHLTDPDGNRIRVGRPYD